MSKPGQAQIWLQRAVFAASLATVLGVSGALLWLDRPGEPEHPAVAARVITARVHAGADRLVVPYEVINQGDVSVEEVLVEVRMPGPGVAPIQQQIQHLPAGSRRRGVVVFYGRHEGQPQALVVGYQYP